MDNENIHANIIAPPHGIETQLSDSSRRFFSITRIKTPDSPCILCDQKITGPYQTDSYGNWACAKHRLTNCADCDNIITEDRVSLHGCHGYVCLSCGTPSTMDEVYPIAMMVRDFCRRKHLFVPEHTISLVTAEYMYNKYYARYNTTPRGMATKLGDQYIIELMCQQSRAGLLKTLAHEMMHLFMYVRNISPEEDICEGFCNLGSYLALVELGGDDPATMVALSKLMENRDARYGVGFRRMKLVYDLKGMDGCIAILREFVGHRPRRR